MARPRRRSRLVVVSNRLPYAFRRGARGRWRALQGGGGLVTALLPVLRDRGGTWVGWPGAAGPAAQSAAALRATGRRSGYRLASVPLDGAEVRGFYEGFSNEIIWPLFHDLAGLCNFDPEYWRIYRAVNAKYARAVLRRAAQGDLVWVHDYHLINVGEELRALGCAARLGFFLHIPFPAPDSFLKLPWRRELLEALLRFDLVGFQTERDLENCRACMRELGIAPPRGVRLGA